MTCTIRCWRPSVEAWPRPVSGEPGLPNVTVTLWACVRSTGALETTFAVGTTRATVVTPQAPFHGEPLRLSVCIEAPREAMTDILSRHDGVRTLFENRWLHLCALDEAGRMAWRYAGDLSWQALDPAAIAPAGSRRQALAVP